VFLSFIYDPVNDTSAPIQTVARPLPHLLTLHTDETRTDVGPMSPWEIVQKAGLSDSDFMIEPNGLILFCMLRRLCLTLSLIVLFSRWQSIRFCIYFVRNLDRMKLHTIPQTQTSQIERHDTFYNNRTAAGGVSFTTASGVT
jgi:hypothetical protein